MAGIVQYESGWHPYAIGDNDTRRAYYPTTAADATAVARQLLNLGHNLDAGLGQVNSDNWRAYGLDVTTVFSGCPNVRVASQILSGDYASAMSTNWIGRRIASNNDAYLQQQYALIHALSDYNSGKFWASMHYATDVYSLASHVVIDEPAAFPGAIPPPGTPLMSFLAPARASSGHHVVRLSTLTDGTHARVAFRPAWSATPPVATLHHKHIAAPHFNG
jgi:hypothetical protein